VRRPSISLWLVAAFAVPHLGCAKEGDDSPEAGNGGTAGTGGTSGNAGMGGNAVAFPVIATTPGRAEYSFSHAGLERIFLVYVPLVMTQPAPLMVVLHGGGGRAEAMFDTHPLESYADQLGYVIVAAQGTLVEGKTNSFEWNGQTLLDSGVDDVGYLDSVILGLSAALDLDSGRRFVAGFSGGASMAVRFGAEKSEHVAAIGTFAGKVGLSQAGAPFVFPMTPTSPLSVQMTYGTLDPNYLGELKGDVQATSAQEGIDWWTDVLSCESTAQTEAKGSLTLATYAGCNGNAVVRFVTVQGMEHTWPEKGGSFDLDGTKLLLDFFGNI
jgi:polyhydroxybutyrate depolymerase